VDDDAALRFFDELENTGEPQVRARYARGVYAGKKKPLAEEWLRRKDQTRALGREQANDASQADMAATASRAAAAAERAATAAEEQAIVAARAASAAEVSASEARKQSRNTNRANIIAALALAMAAIAIAVSIFGLYSQKH
jgi:hypothetical protein